MNIANRYVPVNQRRGWAATDAPTVFADTPQPAGAGLARLSGVDTTSYAMARYLASSAVAVVTLRRQRYTAGFARSVFVPQMAGAFPLSSDIVLVTAGATLASFDFHAATILTPLGGLFFNYPISAVFIVIAVACSASPLSMDLGLATIRAMC